MQPELPIEFLVKGTPVSLQAQNVNAKAAWKALVLEAAEAALQPQEEELDAQCWAFDVRLQIGGKVVDTACSCLRVSSANQSSTWLFQLVISCLITVVPVCSHWYMSSSSAKKRTSEPSTIPEARCYLLPIIL